LIFPAHEQHHNNSFLCAALVLGQSNIPAGATIGSNHNSRAPDGELVAGRGFWPGLCVSLKHNSKLASFTILAKADYSYELNIPIPFSLVSVDPAKDQLVVMPAYWFMYNMYALARNSWKYADRDKQIQPIQQMEYDYLAPDTVNEMFNALSLLEYFAGKAFYKKEKSNTVEVNLCRAKGKELLQNSDPIIDSLEIEAESFENTKRKTIIIKVRKAYALFVQMINYYGSSHLTGFIKNNNIKKIEDLQNTLPSKLLRNEWLNAGGQLMTKADVDTLKKKIREEKIRSWDHLHNVYNGLAKNYLQQKSIHAIASLFEINSLSVKTLTKEDLNNFFTSLLKTKEWITEKIYESKAKDYSNPYRKMTYDTEQEMNGVVGCLSTNSFIQKQQKELELFKTQISLLKKRLKL